MNNFPEKFVGNIGVSSITICGSKSEEFLIFPNSISIRGCVILKFSSEASLVEMLQNIVNMALPFEANPKNDALQLAALYKEKKLIEGDLIGFYWGANGADYVHQ